MRRIRFLFVLSVVVVSVMAMGAGGDDLPRGSHTYGSSGDSEGLSTMSHSWCTIFAEDPWKTGLDINGYGWQYCQGHSSQWVTVTLQKHWWGPWWNNVAQQSAGPSPVNFIDIDVYALCPSGTNTYRVITDGAFNDIHGTHNASVVSQNEPQITC